MSVDPRFPLASTTDNSKRHPFLNVADRCSYWVDDRADIGDRIPSRTPDFYSATVFHVLVFTQQG